MQQMYETPRRKVLAEAGLQQVGDLGQRHSAVRVQLDDQRDHAETELGAGCPQHVGGLQRMPALHAPPILRAAVALDVKAAYKRAHRREGFLLRRDIGHGNRAATVRTTHRGRCRTALVDLRRALAVHPAAIARTGPPAGAFAADRFRLRFISSTARDATPADIAECNPQV